MGDSGACLDRSQQHGSVPTRDPSEIATSTCTMPSVCATWPPPTRTSTSPTVGSGVIVTAMSRLERTIAVARGDEPADLVVSGGLVLSVFTREWLECDVAIADGIDRGSWFV